MKTSDATIRLGRPRSHLLEALSVLESWRSTGGYEWVYGQHEKFAQYAWFFVVHRPVPDAFGVLISDYISNATSALDYLAWAAYLDGGGDPDHKDASHVYYPIVKPGNTWANSKKVKHANQTFLDIARDEQDVAPENLLEMLVAMNNHGKHRQLHLAAIPLQGGTTMTMPLVPEGYDFVMFVNADPISLALTGATSVSTYELLEEGGDLGSGVVAPPEFEFKQPDQPERYFHVSDGSSFMHVGYLEAQLERVERVVHRMANEVPSQ